MPFDWSLLFDNFGLKVVTATDRSRGAYVLTHEQRQALDAAGKDPSLRETFPIEVLFDPDHSSLATSYYESVRAGSGRTPEIRMGRGLINWAKVGDQIVLGNKGNRILVAKVSMRPAVAETLGRELARKGDRKKIFKRALKAKGKPARKTRQVSDFVRDPYVVAAALLRADGVCEMPLCKRELFKRQDGTWFLEVHHVVPLAEGGDDTLANAAALCPACHRELHHGAKKHKKRAVLAAAVAAMPTV
jgi:5-methylcytosine-specific restriction endonuclease McrA